jgi:nesprin-1
MSQEYTAYHQSLQDTEKWLLQISFQLMAHNSLYITNREQTQEQISQHEVYLVSFCFLVTDLTLQLVQFMSDSGM